MQAKTVCSVVQLAAAPTRDVIKIFIALEAAALDGLTRADSRPTRSTIAPATCSTSATARTLTVVAPTTLLLTAVVRSGAVLVSAGASGSPAPNRSAAASFVPSRIPARSLDRMVTSKQRWHTGEAGEARERRHHTVHGEILEVESPRCSLLCLPIVLGEVAIAIGIRS